MKLVLFLLGLFLIGYLLTGVVQVLPGEQAVVRRFGRVLDEHPGPGLWLGFPFGIDRVERVPVDRLQTIQVGFSEDDSSLSIPSGQFLTGDHNLVNIQATLTYKVIPEKLVTYVSQQVRIPGILNDTAEAVLAEWVGAKKVDDVLLRGKLLMRPPVVSQIRQRLERYDLGIEVLDLQVGLIAPPEEVKPAFDNVSRSQTTIATLINRAEQQAESQQQNAEAERYRMEQLSRSDSQSRIVLARQEADFFRNRLREFQQAIATNPNYLRQIWEEERGKILGRLRDQKQIGLLDNHLGADGLDLTTIPNQSR